MRPRPDGEPEPFDMDAFRGDILAYCRRQRIDHAELSARAGLAKASVSRFIRGGRGLGLRAVCLLADACDLSLDSYRVQEEAWV